MNDEIALRKLLTSNKVTGQKCRYPWIERSDENWKTSWDWK
jgi:hypothetical protein